VASKPRGRRGGALRPLVSAWRRLVAGMARLLPEDQRVYLLESLRFHRPLDYAAADIRLHVGSEPELSRLRSISKEPWTARWIEEFIQPGDVFYDIGANIGAYSLLAAKTTEHQARIYAFEPAFANYASLCKNIVLNDCAGCITPLPFPLSGSSDWIQFKYRSLDAGKALHAVGDRLPGKPGESAHTQPAYDQRMLALRLDELCERFHLPPPQHIKLDVDGAELQVLEGASRLLASAHLRSVLVELAESESGSVDAITNCIEAHGLHWHDRFAHAKAGRPNYGLFTRD
jgi:FkbM family methyltransferase